MQNKKGENKYPIYSNSVKIFLIRFISVSKKKFLMRNTKTYNELVQKMRAFFLQKGFTEVPTQSRLSILAACENPHSITTFNYCGEIWPLPQTGQMWLEHELLQNPEWPGCFCISTSYRQEKEPIPGRHELIFPMFEFESKGGMKELLKLESELLEHLGFDQPVEVNYDDVCQEYGGVSILEDEHESKMWKEKSSVVSLQNFPRRTNPFWNMQHNNGEIFNKVDVILYGQETIGSAERSCDVEKMKEMFYTIEDGKYSAKLFELFGKERVEAELEIFLQYDFFPRFGGGIGMTRLARAYEMMMSEKEVEELV
jgi:aspartyl/asparaginyl-tRNA synthetase